MQASSSEDTQLVGRTRGDQVVCFPDGPKSLKGDLLDVRILDARGMTLFATRLQPAASESLPIHLVR